MNEFPQILAFVKDLNFSTRIESAAERQGFELIIIESAEQISLEEGESGRGTLGEPLEGGDGILVENITLWRPALIIFDLGNESIPWLEWISMLTSVSATRGIPVLCYGPHIESNNLEAAKDAGATKVVTRSNFVKNLPYLIMDLAKVINPEELRITCDELLSYYARKGLDKFNRGEYFEAHDLLEIAWKEDQSPGRELYRAILQVSVAYYQILRGNYNGAAKMFLRMRKWLDPLPDICRGINIRKLRREARAVHQELQRLGAERILEFDTSMLRRIEFQE